MNEENIRFIISKVCSTWHHQIDHTVSTSDIETRNTWRITVWYEGMDKYGNDRNIRIRSMIHNTAPEAFMEFMNKWFIYVDGDESVLD